MSFTVTASFEAEIDELISHYPVNKRSASLMLLHATQEQFGYISKEAIEWIAGKLGLQPINVYELVTFYPMFRQEQPGKYVLKVCRTLSCALGGSHKLHHSLCEKFGLEPAQARLADLEGRQVLRRVRGMLGELWHGPGHDVQ